MSRFNNKPGDAPGPKKPYKVGDKKPPLHSRFKKGKSGNPSGRPKGHTPFGKSLMAEFNKSVLVLKNGQTIKLTNKQLFAIQLVKAGITKGPQSSALLLALVRQCEADLAAEAAAHEAKKQLEPKEVFSWTEEQEKLYQELEDAIKKEGLDDGRQNTPGDESE